MEDDLKKNERRPHKKRGKDGRQPEKNIMEDNLKNNFKNQPKLAVT
jgi:hypothetical protein